MTSPMALSLRMRLFIAGAVALVAALIVAAMGMAVLFERHVERRLAADLAVVLEELASGIARDDNGALTIDEEPTDARFDRPLSGLYWQAETDAGVAFARSRSLWDTELHLPKDELPEGNLHRHRIAGPGDTTLMVVERRVKLPARLGATQVRLVVGRDAADLTTATRLFTADMAPYIAMIALLLIAAFGAQVAVGLRPLRAIRTHLAAIRSGTVERLGAALPHEVQPLAAEIDALLEARDRQVTAARAHAADLAHGLKTPLQVLAGDVERLKARGENEIAADLETIGESMRRHIERELARARRLAPPADAVADVAAASARVVEVVRRTPRGEALTWQIDVPAGLSARVPADELVEVLGNLLDNATRHARAAVRIAAATCGDDVVIHIIDDGAGIPADRIEEVLKRGGALDRGGTGLGLSIAGDILSAWGGTLTLGPTDPGAMTANVRLPRAAS